MLAPGILIALLLLTVIGFAARKASRRPPLRLAVRVGFAVLWLAFTALFALAFYDRYWRWRDCFNELGRCYDPEHGVMVEQAGAIWGSLTLIFGLLSIRSLWGFLCSGRPGRSVRNCIFRGFSGPFHARVGAWG
jgi:hypothetical protein